MVTLAGVKSVHRSAVCLQLSRTPCFLPVVGVNDKSLYQTHTVSSSRLCFNLLFKSKHFSNFLLITGILLAMPFNRDFTCSGLME